MGKLIIRNKNLKYIKALVLFLAFFPLSTLGQEEDTRSQSMLLLGMEQQADIEPDATASHYAVSISFEPGIITSKVYDGYKEVACAGGNGFSIEGWHVKNGRGIGLTYSQNSTYYDERPLKLYFGGASCLWASEWGGHWAANVAVGLGFAYYSYNSPHYLNYKNETETLAGVGFMTRGGIEYLPVKFVGLALDVRALAYIFPSGTPAEAKGIPGFERLSLNLGLRFHI